MQAFLRFVGTKQWIVRLCLMMVLMSGWSVGWGQIVAFNNTWSGSPATVTATTTNSNLGTVTLSRGAGITASTSSAGFRSTGFASGTSLTLANNDFYTFTLNANSGFFINLNSATLTVSLGSSGTGPQSYGIYSSVGGFTSTTAQIGSNLTASNSQVINFPSSGYNGLSTIEIRIYGWNASAGTGTGGPSAISLTGTVTAASCTAPTTQASNISFSNIQSNQMSVNWTNGNGAGRVVVMNTSNSFTAPSNGSNPTANLTYGGSGEQVVFNGTGSGPITVTGLNASTTYWFRVYEYCSPDRNYNTSTGTNNPNSQATASAGPSTNANLSALSLSNGTLSPTFASGTTSYTASVANSITSTTVTPVLADANATVRVNGVSVISGTASAPINLTVGSNIITVQVTAQDGVTVTTYTINVTRLSNVSTLSALTLSAGTLSPTFASGTTSYTATVANAVTSITVTPTVTSSLATVRVNNVVVTSGTPSASIPLAVGSNTIPVLVTAQDGSTTTYTITVIRISNVSSLSGLTLSTGTLTPAFASGTTSYTATVGNNVSSITVTSILTDPNATATVNGNAVTSGAPSGAISLVTGNNTITVLVTAQDGVSTTTYTITVNRLAVSSDANLSALTISSGTLSPAFNASVTTYAVTVSNATGSIAITPTTNDANATVTVNGNAAISGIPSNVSLSVGDNSIPIVVTAQDGTTIKTYTLNVRRQSTVSSLSNLTLSSGTLSPSFNESTLSYSVSVANAVTSTTVTPTVAAGSNATVTVNNVAVTSGSASGAINLNVGSNTITVLVTSEDGSSTTTYTVVVNRAASSVSTLSALTLSAGTLSPSFASGTTSYTASVGNAVTSITVTPTATSSLATITVNGVSATSGVASNPIALAVGTNTITILITAQDGITTTTYTINVTRADANAATVIWALTTNATATTVTPNVTAGNQTSGSGINTPTYGGNGVSSSGWAGSAVGVIDPNEYYQFTVSPLTNYTLTVNSISTTNNLSSQTATGVLQYSYSPSFTSPQTIGSTFALSSTSVTTNFNGLSIVVNSGQTLYLRLFVYRTGTDGLTSAQTVRTRDFTINGTSIQLLSPPTLTPASGATVDAPFNVTFTDDPASQTWVSTGGTAVTVNGTALTAGFSISNGQITFTPSASVPASLLQTPGTKTIVISKTGYGDASVSQTISVGAPAQLTVNTQPTAPTISGGTLATQPAVTVRDQYGNAVGAGITVNAAVTSGQTSNWSLGGTTSATTNGSGVAAFSNLTATNQGSSAFTTATITFTPGSGSGSVNSSTFTVPAPASQLAITAITPSSPSAGSGFNVTVQAQDAGNTATNVLTATGISLSTNGNAGTIGGTITGTINAGSNTVTISGVVLPNAGTGVTLTATQTSGTPVVTAGTSSTFSVLDAASYVTFENVPATGSAGTNLSSFTVSARRTSDGSVDQAFTGTITISKNSGPGTLSGTLSVTAVNGVATFNAAQFNQAGTYTLAASSGSLTGATSGNIVVSLQNATVILWSAPTGVAWLSSTNWTGGAVPSSTQVAQFGVNPTPGTAININGGTTSTGAIELNSNRIINLTIGNNSGTASNGTLTLNGVVVNGVPNVIIRNNSIGNLTIQNTGSTGSASNTLALALGNTSDNVIQIENSGNVTISSIITGTGRSLTKAGNGSGILTLSGNNTYTGATTVTGGTLSIPKTGYTATITTSAVTVAFSPAPALGTYTFLPGALTNGGQTFSATGLASNQTASFNFANSTVTVSISQSAADYRTKQSGNFNNASTWEFFNGTAWTDATQVPSSTNNVTVQNGHTITQDADFTVGTGKSLTLDATSSWIVNANSTLTVTGTANFNNQSVVFRSTASGDGMYGNSSGTINGGGNVTVERYLGNVNKRAWRLLTAPVNGSTNNSVFFNWQNNGTVTGNTGAEIWGPAGTGAGGNGLAVGPLTSLRTFNNATQSFVDVTDSKTQPLFNTSNNNPTFYLFLSGPYGSGNITNTSIFSPTTLRATGSLLTGNKTFSTTAAANGFYFVSNPYASTVNQGNSGTVGSPVYPLNISNATNAIYFWDPNLAGLFGAGGYVAFDRLQNTYSIPSGEGPAGTLTYQSGTNYTRLQSGSAFVLQAVNAGAISVDFTEATKGGAASPGVFRTIGNTSEKIRVTLQRNSNGNYITTDGAVAFYYDNANAGVDRMDAAKFNNNSDNLMLRRNGRNLTFEHRPTVALNDTLFIGMANTSAATYRFVIEASDFAATAGLRAVLQDLYLNTEATLNLYGSTTVTFSVDGNAASTGNNRFRIVLRPDAATSVRNADAEKWLKVYPNPVAKGASLQVELKNRTAGTYQMAVYNALGMQVYRVQFVHGGSNTVQRIQLPATLSNGVYVAEIMDAKGNKEEIKITIQ